MNEINVDEMTNKVLEKIKKKEHKEMFGDFNCVHNLREVKSNSCRNCANLMEDVAGEGYMSFYICPLQGEYEITFNKLICDKYISSTSKPKQTERRKNTMDFTEFMDYNSKKKSNRILDDDEITALTNAMDNADKLATDINKPLEKLLDEVFEEAEENKKPLEEDFEYGIFSAMAKKFKEQK